MKLEALHHEGRLPARRARRRRIGRRDPLTPLPFSGALDDRRGDEMLHRGLFRLNRRRLQPGMVAESTLDLREALCELATIQFFESRILGGARGATGPHASEAPKDGAGLLAWLEGLRAWGPGQLDPIWSWIATQASERALHWFVLQELVAEVATKELVDAVLGPRATLPALERFRNVAMLLGTRLPRDAADDDDVTWEAMARANLVTALAVSRGAQASGAMAAMMMVQPARLALIDQALGRLGYEVDPPSPPADRHAVSQLLQRELAHDRGSAVHIACGALMWMRAGVRCLDGYRERVLHDSAA